MPLSFSHYSGLPSHHGLSVLNLLLNCNNGYKKKMLDITLQIPALCPPWDSMYSMYLGKSMNSSIVGWKVIILGMLLPPLEDSILKLSNLQVCTIWPLQIKKNIFEIKLRESHTLYIPQKIASALLSSLHSEIFVYIHAFAILFCNIFQTIPSVAWVRLA